MMRTRQRSLKKTNITLNMKYKKGKNIFSLKREKLSEAFDEAQSASSTGFLQGLAGNRDWSQARSASREWWERWQGAPSPQLSFITGYFHLENIWLQLPEFISFLLSYLNLSILLRPGLKSNSLNMHKKTTNWRILVVVVKWRHLTIALLTQISPKRAIASYWWILVALSAYFFCCHQNASQRHIGSQTFFLCFICLHIWIKRVMLSNLKYRHRRKLFTKRNEKKGLVYLSVSLIIHNKGRN